MKEIPREFFARLEELDRKHREARAAYLGAVESYREGHVTEKDLRALFEAERAAWNQAHVYFSDHFGLERLEG